MQGLMMDYPLTLTQYSSCWRHILGRSLAQRCRHIAGQTQ